MNLQDFVKALRTQWLTVLATTLACMIAAVVITITTTPLYQASTRLFVSTTAGSSMSDKYQGNRLSQDRVLSYMELIKGETLSQRVVDKLNLDISAKQLRENVSATSKLDTVLIKVTVLDKSPVRARDIANALSDEFVKMARELETPAPGANPDARVVVEQRASVPSSPVVPNKLRNIAAGLGLGLLLGIGLALLRMFLDNTVKDREKIEEITGVGLIGSIPLDKERRSNPAISFESENSAIAEAFRKMRTNLQFLSVDDPPRVIVVTSSAPSEGKSTTAINLALSLAEAENSVVLVDGDLRRPTVSKYLDLVSAVGFSTVLSGAAPLSDVLQDTKFPRLTVLAAGATPPNPSELLGSHAAKRTLEELRSRFDFVIVDSPPLLAVTDAAVLATNADGALVMTRFGETKREQLAHAVRSLRDAGANVLGAVFTLVPTSGPGYYGSYRYNYSYYGESETKTRTKSRRTMKFSRPKSDGPSSAQQPPEERPESADVTQSRIDI